MVNKELVAVCIVISVMFAMHTTFGMHLSFNNKSLNFTFNNSKEILIRIYKINSKEANTYVQVSTNAIKFVNFSNNSIKIAIFPKCLVNKKISVLVNFSDTNIVSNIRYTVTVLANSSQKVYSGVIKDSITKNFLSRNLKAWQNNSIKFSDLLNLIGRYYKAKDIRTYRNLSNNSSKNEYTNFADPIKFRKVSISDPLFNSTSFDYKQIWRYDIYCSLKYIFTNRKELNKVIEIAKNLKGKNIIQDAWNILRWEQLNIKYNQTKANLPPPKIVISNGHITVINKGKCRYIQTPYETVHSGRGICVDYAILTDALLLDMNNSCYFVLIKFNNGQTHASAAINFDGWFIFLDQHMPPMDMWSYYHNWMCNGEIIKNAMFFKINKSGVYILGALNGSKFTQKYPSNTNLVLNKIGSLLLFNLTPNIFLNKDTEKVQYYQYYPYYCGLFYREYALLSYIRIYKMASKFKFYWIKVSNVGNGLLVKYTFANNC